MRKIITTVFVAALTMTAFAQSGTNSPYSQYGLGVLSDQTSGFNRGMNGLGIGFHEHNQVNFLNPASYATVDSLTFIFDAGFSGQITNFKEGGKKINANNATFEYAVGAFRVAKHLGLSFGILPYTNIGYSYSSKAYLNDEVTSSSTYYVNSYNGSGGIHQIYLGLGWQPFKGLSVGVNGSYIWGEYTRSVVNSYNESAVNTISKYYTASVKNYKLDFGLQYAVKLNKKDEVTVGATFSPGHKLSADPECMVLSTNNTSSVTDTASYVAKNALAMPTTIGVGLAWIHDRRVKVGVDYTLQKWGSVDYPQYTESNNAGHYEAQSGLFSDRHKVTLGGEYCANENGRTFFKRIRYRFGASFATPYLKIAGQDGPKEYSVSAGFGIPIVNTFNNRSILNISAQWVRQDCKTFITENTFRINVGITFNERWFAKWKME